MQCQTNWYRLLVKYLWRLIYNFLARHHLKILFDWPHLIAPEQLPVLYLDLPASQLHLAAVHRSYGWHWHHM